MSILLCVQVICNILLIFLVMRQVVVFLKRYFLFNGEKIVRDWFVRMIEKQSFSVSGVACFYNGPEHPRPSLAQIQGIN